MTEICLDHYPELLDAVRLYMALKLVMFGLHALSSVCLARNAAHEVESAACALPPAQASVTEF